MGAWLVKYVTRFTAFTFGISVGALIPLMFEPTPKPPTTPTLTQSQLDQAVSMLDRHGNTTIANKAKIMKLETRLKQLEQRMNATLPDPRRMK